MDRFLCGHPESGDQFNLLLVALTYLCLAITAKIIIGIVRENYEPCYQLARKLQTKAKGTNDN